MIDVALITCNPPPIFETEEEILLGELRKIGLSGISVAWDDPEFDWSTCKLAVVRSTWDYWHRRNEFIDWAREVEKKTSLWNSAKIIEWNTHKSYLKDLTEKGVSTIPTIWTEKDSSDRETFLVIQDLEWQEYVIKPAVSGGAENTKRFQKKNVDLAHQHLCSIVQSNDAMIQPYLSSVDDYGERSLLYIDGEFTHSVRRPSILNGQVNKMSSMQIVPMVDEEVQFASHVLRSVSEPLLYARIDFVRDSDGKYFLMELELVEPSLFLTLSEKALNRFSNAIKKKLL